MATKADRLRWFCLHEAGKIHGHGRSPYVWGRQGYGGPEGYDPYDCSGYAWAGFKFANGNKQLFARTTADGIYHMSRRISKPSRVGDMFVLRNRSGTATHIGFYIGHGQTSEARGRLYGVRNYTVAQLNRRGAVWIRNDKWNLGSLTTAKRRIRKTMGARHAPGWQYHIDYKVTKGETVTLLDTKKTLLYGVWGHIQNSHGSQAWTPLTNLLLV